MVRLVSVAICRQDEQQSFVLCQETDLSGLLFGKKNIREVCRFAARQTSLSIDKCVMASLNYKGNIVHCFKKMNGLSAVAITDGDYSNRAAHGLIRKILSDFEKQIDSKVWQSARDDEINFPSLSQYLKTYKIPPKDKMQEIEQEIENTKQIVVCTCLL